MEKTSVRLNRFPEEQGNVNFLLDWKNDAFLPRAYAVHLPQEMTSQLAGPERSAQISDRTAAGSRAPGSTPTDASRRRKRAHRFLPGRLTPREAGRRARTRSCFSIDDQLERFPARRSVTSPRKRATLALISI